MKISVLFKTYHQKGYFFVVILLFFSVFSFSQSNDLFEFDNQLNANIDNCLTKKSDFNNFKLKNVKPKVDLNDLEIRVEVLYENQKFDSLEAFNDFDFKLWLKNNEGFEYKANLKISIRYDIGNQIFEQVFVFCLDDVSEETIIKSRGDAIQPDIVKLPIYYGTDRNFRSKESNFNNVFGTERAKLSYGVVEVSIPHDHKIGEIETPSIWKFEFSEDPSKHVMVQGITRLGKKKFFSKLSQDISYSDKKSTFLFVHGYNTSFSEAAKRTAQISYDLKFDGKAVFYSWPSQASTFLYRTDEKNIAWSSKNLKLFLEDYLSISEAEEIYLIAHSMGNRSLTQAIIEVMKSKPELGSKLKEIILAAPDIDADVFKTEIAPKMVSETQKPITLYVSADDLALKASKLLNGKPRAGEIDNLPIIIDGVETIDATGVDTSFLKHSYFADNSSIISDIFDLIQSGNRALKRELLFLVQLQSQFYFKVKE